MKATRLEAVPHDEEGLKHQDEHDVPGAGGTTNQSESRWRPKKDPKPARARAQQQHFSAGGKSTECNLELGLSMLFRRLPSSLLEQERTTNQVKHPSPCKQERLRNLRHITGGGRSASKTVLTPPTVTMI